jgi:uncharacterized membrane protein
MKGLAMNFTIVVIIIGLVLLFFFLRNNKKRKENLNIVREDNRLHLFLSDDHFLSMELNNGQITDEIYQNIIEEASHMKENIRKISFINFENSRLKEELNRILELK